MSRERKTRKMFGVVHWLCFASSTIRAGDAFDYIEAVCIGIFTIEYVA